TLPYAVLLGLLAAAIVGAWFMPEPVSPRGRLRLTWERPSVPPAVRRPFVLAGLAVLASWSLGGLFFSLGPQLSAQLFGSSNAVVAAGGVIALSAAATLAQLAFGRTAPWLLASAGSLALAAGMLLIVAAAAAGSGVAYGAGALIAGAGFGVTLLGGLRALGSAIPPEHPAAVMAAFFGGAHLSLSVPAVLAGLVVRHLGLRPPFARFRVV